MTNAGDGRPRPSGFLANLRAAYTPRPLSEAEAEQAAVQPQVVKIGAWLIMAVGAVFLISAMIWFGQKDSFANERLAEYNSQVASCTADFGGVGDAVTATEETDAVKDCKAMQILTQENIDAFKSALTFNGIVIGFLGLLVGVGGWLVKKERAVGRRLAMIGAGLVFVLMMFGPSVGLGLLYIWNLPAVLILIVAVSLLYTGKGGRYFALARSRPSGPASK